MGPVREVRAVRYLFALGAIVWTSTASASITVTINTPSAGQAVGDSLSVGAAVASNPFQVSTVRASVGSVTAPLTATPGQGYAATLDISSIPIGNATLTVTATDAA